MKSEDETDLSAYLDDELDPGDRRDLESALLSDPALAARLAGLAAARDAVAMLSRPEAPCSLVSSVMSRIEAVDRQGRRRPYYWFATAASVLFALILSLRSGLLAPPHAPGQPALVRNPAPTVAVRPEADANAVAVTRPGPASTSLTSVTVPPARLGPAADPGEDDRRRFVAMLDRPGLIRIMILTDVIDPGAADRVGGLLRETARKQPDFGRVSVVQGIVIDPGFPNGAEVFAAVMDEPEREQLFARLTDAFPGAIIEGETPPEVTLNLAEVGRISIDSGRSAAGLREPPADASIVAFRNAQPRPGRAEVIPRAVGEPPFEGVPGGDMRGLPLTAVLPPELIGEHPAERKPPADREPPAPAPKKNRKASTGSAPVLVWVTSGQPARRPE